MDLAIEQPPELVGQPSNSHLAPIEEPAPPVSGFEKAIDNDVVTEDPMDHTAESKTPNVNDEKTTVESITTWRL